MILSVSETPNNFWQIPGMVYKRSLIAEIIPSHVSFHVLIILSVTNIVMQSTNKNNSCFGSAQSWQLSFAVKVSI